MSDQLEPTTPPEELARANPTTLTALWRVIQIDKDEDRFEQAEIYLDSDSLDTTGIEIVADAMRERFNEYSELRAEVVKQRRRKQELEAEVERLRGTIKKIRIWLSNTPGYRRGKHWEEAMWHAEDALDGGGDND